jgi:hypothetical protein
MPSRLRTLTWHFMATVGFAGLAVAWTWPLATSVSNSLPGPAGDNLAFLWNDWWMRTAIAEGRTPFQTDRLFAPLGGDLTLYTHSALASWLGATVLGRVPLVTAHNLLILVALTLNGVAAYAFAFARTRSAAAAFVAGLIFAGSPYLSAHLLGHVNLLWAWGLPLFAWCALHVVERQSWKAAAACGVIVALTAYNDYYYAIYCGVLLLALLAFRVFDAEWLPVDRGARWRSLLKVLLAVDLLLVMSIVVSGGFTATIAGIRVSANRPTNLLAFGWALLVLLLLTRWRLQIRQRAEVRPLLAPSAIVVGVAALALWPLLRHALALVVSGGYVAPVASWRSGPGGVDLATLILGHPWHGVIGASVRDAYSALGINTIESVGWLGLVPMVLLVVAFTRYRAHADVRLWRWLGGVFFVWALGPWLRVGGFDTGLLLPQNLLAHLPLLSNARMPGRAMVIVFLALGMVAARVIAEMAPRRRALAASAACLVLVIDLVPAPFPLTRLATPVLYSTLRTLPPGAVCELPMGVHHGFGAVGRFDSYSLLYQATHQHPIVGGAASRPPTAVLRAYAEMPVVRSLLWLSEGKPADAADVAMTPEAAGAALRQASIRYVVLNRESAPAPLVDFVNGHLPLKAIAREGSRELFQVQGVE